MEDFTNNPLDNITPEIPIPDALGDMQDDLAQQQQEDTTPDWLQDGSASNRLIRQNSFEFHEGLGAMDYVKDFGLGIATGVASAVEGVLELPTIVGFDYDIPDNFGIPETDTWVGGLTDGIVNFGVGFAMGGGGIGLSIASKMGKIGKTGTVLRQGRSWLPKRASAGGWGKNSGLAGNMTIREELFKGSIQGGVVDGMFFRGQEGRLSDLVMEYPALENPISAMLATDWEMEADGETYKYDDKGRRISSDWEITGRVKNVLEGLGIGFLADSLIVGVKWIAKGRKVIENGGTDAEAFDVARRGVAKDMEGSFNISEEEADAVAHTAELMGVPLDMIDVVDRATAEEGLNAMPLFQSADSSISGTNKGAFVELGGGDSFFFKGIQDLITLDSKGGGNQSLAQSLKGIPLAEREALGYDEAILKHRQLFEKGEVPNEHLTVKQFLENRRDVIVKDWEFSSDHVDGVQDEIVASPFVSNAEGDFGIGTFWAKDSINSSYGGQGMSWSFHSAQNDLEAMVGNRVDKDGAGPSIDNPEGIKNIIKDADDSFYVPHIPTDTNGTPKFSKSAGEVIRKGQGQGLYSVKNNQDLLAWVLQDMVGHHKLMNGTVPESDNMFAKFAKSNHDGRGVSEVSIARHILTTEGKRYTVVLENVKNITQDTSTQRPKPVGASRQRNAGRHPDSDTTNNISRFVSQNGEGSHIGIRVVDTTDMIDDDVVGMLKDVYDIHTKSAFTDDIISTKGEHLSRRGDFAEDGSVNAVDILDNDGNFPVGSPLFNDKMNPLEQNFLSFFRDSEYDNASDTPSGAVRTIGELTNVDVTKGDTARTPTTATNQWSSPSEVSAERLEGISEVHRGTFREWSITWGEEGVGRVHSKDDAHKFTDVIQQTEGIKNSDSFFPTNVMHMRTMEATDVNGNRILLVNEVQKDWQAAVNRSKAKYIENIIQGRSSGATRDPLTATEAREHDNPRAIEVYNTLKELEGDGFAVFNGSANVNTKVSESFELALLDHYNSKYNGRNGPIVRVMDMAFYHDFDDLSSRDFEHLFNGRTNLVLESNSANDMPDDVLIDANGNKRDNVNDDLNGMRTTNDGSLRFSDGTDLSEFSLATSVVHRWARRVEQGSASGTVRFTPEDVARGMEGEIPESLKQSFSPLPIWGDGSITLAEYLDGLTSKQISRLSIYIEGFNKIMSEAPVIQEMAFGNGNSSYAMNFHPDGPAAFRELRILELIRKDIASNENSALSLFDFDAESVPSGNPSDVQRKLMRVVKSIHPDYGTSPSRAYGSLLSELGGKDIKSFMTFDVDDNGRMHDLPIEVVNIQEHLSAETLLAIKSEARVLRNMHKLFAPTPAGVPDSDSLNEALAAVMQMAKNGEEAVKEIRSKQQEARMLLLEERRFKYDEEGMEKENVVLRDALIKVREAASKINKFKSTVSSPSDGSDTAIEIESLVKKLIEEVNLSDVSMDNATELSASERPRLQRDYVKKFGEEVTEQSTETPTPNLEAIMSSDLTVEEKMQRAELYLAIPSSGASEVTILDAREGLAKKLLADLASIAEKYSETLNFNEGLQRDFKAGHTANTLTNDLVLKPDPLRKLEHQVALHRMLLSVADSDDLTGMRVVKYDELLKMRTHNPTTPVLYNERLPRDMDTLLKSIFGKKYKKGEDVQIIEGNKGDLPAVESSLDARQIFKDPDTDFQSKLEEVFNRNHAESPEAIAEKLAVINKTFAALDDLRPKLSPTNLEEWISYTRRAVDGEIEPATTKARMRKILKESSVTSAREITIGDTTFTLSSVPMSVETRDIRSQQLQLNSSSSDVEVISNIIGSYPTRVAQKYTLKTSDGEDLLGEATQTEIFDFIMRRMSRAQRDEGSGFRPFEGGDGDSADRGRTGNTILLTEDAKEQIKKHKQRLFQSPQDRMAGQETPKTIADQETELSMEYTSYTHLKSLDKDLPLREAMESMPNIAKAEEDFVGITRMLKDNPEALVGDALLNFKPLKFKIKIREGLAMHGTSDEPLTFGNRGTDIVERDLRDIDLDDTHMVETGRQVTSTDTANLEIPLMSPSDTLQGREFRDLKSIRITMEDMELYDHGSLAHFEGELGVAGEIRIGTFDGVHGTTLAVYGAQTDWLNATSKADKVSGSLNDVIQAKLLLEKTDILKIVDDLEAEYADPTTTKKRRGKIERALAADFQGGGPIRKQANHAKALVASEEAGNRIPPHPFTGKNGKESKKIFYRNIARILIKYAKDEGVDSVRIGTAEENNTVVGTYTDGIIDYKVLLKAVERISDTVGLVKADYVETNKRSYSEYAMDALEEAFGPSGTHRAKAVKLNDGYVFVEKVYGGGYSASHIVFNRIDGQIQGGPDLKSSSYVMFNSLEDVKKHTASMLKEHGTSLVDTIDEGSNTFKITEEAINFLDTKKQPFFQSPSKSRPERAKAIQSALDKGFKATDDEVLKHVLKSELQERIAFMGGGFASRKSKAELITTFRRLVAEKEIHEKSRSVSSITYESTPSEVKQAFPLMTNAEAKEVDSLFGSSRKEKEVIEAAQAEFENTKRITELANNIFNQGRISEDLQPHSHLAETDYRRRVTARKAEYVLGDEILSLLDKPAKKWLKALLGVDPSRNLARYHIIEGFGGGQRGHRKSVEIHREAGSRNLAKLTERIQVDEVLSAQLETSFIAKHSQPMESLLKTLDDKYSRGKTAKPKYQGTFDAEDAPLASESDWSEAKGVSWEKEDGRYLIAGLKNSDVTTAVHEIGHAVRNLMYRRDTPRAFTPEQRSLLEDAYGVQDGDWKVEHEEMFARDYERYFMTGEAPEGASKGLISIFKKLASAMLSIYTSLSKSDIKIHENVKKVFDEQIQKGIHDSMIEDGVNLATNAVGAVAKDRQPLHQSPPSEEGIAVKYEARLKEEFGSIENAPEHKVKALQDMIANQTDPTYVEYYDQTGADLWSNYGRPDEPANPRKLAREEDLKDIFTQHVRILVAEGNMGKGAEVSPMEQRLVADELTDFYGNIIGDLDESGFAKMLMGKTEALQSSMIEAQAIRNMTQAIGDVFKETLFEIRALKDAGQDVPDELFAEAFLLSNRMGTLLQTVEKQNGLFGRGLADLRRIPDSKFDNKKLTSDEDLSQFGSEMNIDKDKWVQQELDALNAGDYALMRVSLGKSKTRFGKIINELYYNALLSGPRTHTVNILSGIMNSIFLPIEKASGRIFTNASAKEEIGSLYHMFSQITNGLKFGFLAYRNASSQLDPKGMNTLDVHGAYKGKSSLTEAAGGDKDSIAGKVVDWFYNRLNMPTRFMGGADETIKHINYAANVKSKLMHKAQDMFPKDRAAQIEYVESNFATMTEKGQMYTAKRIYESGQDRAREVLGPDATKTEIRKFANEYLNKNWDDDLGRIADESLERAREATFTQKNDPALGANAVSAGMQKLGAMVQRAALRMPVLRLFVPFINTPTNLLTFYLDRQLSPLFDSVGLLKSTWNKEIYSSPEAKADAIGRLMTGSALTFTTLGLISSNKLTGGGPKDPNKRKLWIDAGYQPYSILIGDKYVSYARLDPWASFLGTLSDLHEGLMDTDGSNIERSTIELSEDILSAAVMAVSRNLGQKTYLQGFTRLAKVIDDPDTYGESYLQSMLAMAIPTGVHQMNQDPYWREVESVTDKFKSRLPSYSEELMPRRNLFGEPIEKPAYLGTGLAQYLSPFAASEVSDDKIKQEFYKLNHAFQPPSITKSGQLNLKDYKSKSGQTAYDRWQELHGTVTLAGKTLKEKLGELIESDRYQRMPEMNEAGDNPKAEYLRKFVSKYRARAYRQVLKEFPVLKANEDAVRYNDRARRIGGQEKQLQDIPKFYK